MKDLFLAVRVDGEADGIGFPSMQEAERFCKLHLAYVPINTWSVESAEEAQKNFFMARAS